MSFKPILLNLSNNQEIEITKDRFSVGRSLQADYVLNSLAVSRIHFYLEAINDGWVITDNSTNGTLVNEELLKSSSRILRPGDLIKSRGGSTTLRFSDNSSRFVTTSSTPVLGFIVSTISGDNLPSVSNDHCYERRGAEGEKTSSSGNVFPVDAVAPSSTSNTSGPPTTASSPSLKRDRSPETAENLKRNKSKDVASNNGDNFKEELECSVCQELFIKAVTLNCSHTFCNSCILKWRSQRNYCPICREPIKTINPTIALDNIIDKFMEDMDKDTKEQREQVVKERSKENQKSTSLDMECLLLMNTVINDQDVSPIIPSSFRDRTTSWATEDDFDEYNQSDGSVYEDDEEPREDVMVDNMFEETDNLSDDPDYNEEPAEDGIDDMLDMSDEMDYADEEADEKYSEVDRDDMVDMYDEMEYPDDGPGYCELEQDDIDDMLDMDDEGDYPSDGPDFDDYDYQYYDYDL